MSSEHSLSNNEPSSDKSHHVASADFGPVMASLSTQNVVNSTQSIGDESPVDVHANQISTASAGNGSTPSLIDTSNPHLAAPQQEIAHNETDNSPPHLIDGIISSLDHEDASAIQESVEGGDTDLFGDDGGALDSHLDPSVESDTDLSRADSTEQGKDAQGLRANSVKKLASFKPVSVTKSFLAKTAILPLTAKPGEKGEVGPFVLRQGGIDVVVTGSASVVAQPILKPRLVAKSGSGLRDIPRARTGGDAAIDGATVWNKNRRRQYELV